MWLPTLILNNSALTRLIAIKERKQRNRKTDRPMKNASNIIKPITYIVLHWRWGNIRKQSISCVLFNVCKYNAFELRDYTNTNDSRYNNTGQYKFDLDIKIANI